MGCAPSIHISDSRVVYHSGKESDDSSSPRPPSAAALAPPPQGLPVSGLLLKSASAASYKVRANSSKREKKENSQNVEAETQTGRCSVKGSVREVQFGSMRLHQDQLQVLLVFAKEDSQSNGFCWACEKAGFRCNIARTPESALESFLDKHHEIIIIDQRHSRYLDAEALCRSIRATKPSENTVIIAVSRRHGDRDEASIMPLISAGFTRSMPVKPEENMQGVKFFLSTEDNMN